MSEYWKSTPKYWCKHCKTFVRDTKLEKTNHEATPKHQGNLKRFLRDLHRGHEREEREAQRAKDEVARLDGIVSGSTSASASTGWALVERKLVAAPENSTSRQATPTDRKQQLKQLAEMGVAIPEEFRREMAMAGDWQTLSQRVVFDDVKQEEDRKDSKPDGLDIGVRKRRYEGQEEDEEMEAKLAKKAWGSSTRTYPDIGGSGDDDLESLLRNTTVLKQGFSPSVQAPITNERSTAPQSADAERSSMDGTLLPQVQSIKKEDSENGGILAVDKIAAEAPGPDESEALSIKTEIENEDTGIVFKKRKAKPIRQR